MVHQSYTKITLHLQYNKLEKEYQQTIVICDTSAIMVILHECTFYGHEAQPSGYKGEHECKMAYRASDTENFVPRKSIKQAEMWIGFQMQAYFECNYVFYNCTPSWPTFPYNYTEQSV